ncbi:MAG: acyl-CoA thioesterase [Myxococcota bacterium]
MARVQLQMPERYLFSTEMAVRVSDVNYGGHLGNDAILSMIHEARARFLEHYGYTELDIEGVGLIMTDAAIIYRAEGFYGDRVRVDVTVDDFNEHGCDFYYLLTAEQRNVEIARAKTGIVFFDYEARKVVDVPGAFRTTVFAEP